MAGPGRPKNPPTPRRMLKEVLPIELIFDDDEIELYNKLVDVYLQDFDIEDLTSSDMDDILDLAKNRVLEFRLLKTGKDSANVLDTAGAIEKLSKKNEKIKESLSSRRRDRINPNEFKGFSIVDLAINFNQEKKRAMEEKMAKLRDEQKKMEEKRADYHGNRYDSDVKERREDE